MKQIYTWSVTLLNHKTYRVAVFATSPTSARRLAHRKCHETTEWLETEHGILACPSHHVSYDHALSLDPVVTDGRALITEENE